ncbi:MAG: AAA family ATPase [Candidatus Thiodiazotropha endolucinida]|uniref:CobQ/CobB/MinD/ParA nucleotide binding domain protein n=2 Tax=Candidatus Thiodiazotropha TaxID=1913444 RepID=A0A7Z0VJA5_9GAMM|nr:AAA family ATPase [Candidatus Thiodiazotropha endolucinida]MBT3017603.1 AAA family ATPase [Candidatus Thiodiazotropha taylori]MBT3031929.1 AAA family ATPase [Candidatus Thiodiazotropha sp. (ex Lucina pensylvanica)]MBT3039754.1 AAA family ATPase [Candidatus Thiodiazotropha sp. (ex Codakia orbicularis)]MBV2104703.1 AAA family ATPase [Candidatus Thiodiazotropha sp. (ex Lucina aurantia)]MCU7943741.1 AAA family ATPase [Candidatus Thiodiazotropha sp. (ex Cardiolucina cf. quadrata)]
MITVIGSLKGGSGKSTVTFNLAVWLEMAEAEVLVIDADPQATLSDVSEVRTEEGYEPYLNIKNASALSRKKLAGYDEVLIDVGTSDIDSMKLALALADRVVIPVPPSQADIWSTQRFINFLDEAVDGDRPDLLAFINRADTHHAIRESDEAAAALVSLPDVDFIKYRLCQRTVFRRSFSEGLAVYELDPRGKGSKEFYALTAALYPKYISQ